MVDKLPEEEHPKPGFGWAARDQSGVLSPFKFSRRATGEKDVAFKVLYCGICHSDLHMVKNEWGVTQYPLIPGYHDGTVTYGCYSDSMVADEHFIVRIPDNLPPDAGAPLLCAGITVYSPLRYFGLDKPGMQVGIVGLGGLGHVAVKFAGAMGVKVTVISTSPDKKTGGSRKSWS
ncbi:mannitol dehydrogenase [Populus alba x Populus x berolinensis]|nr:mannitol dehydrogenase [Populus alba x Populus x berolinensis]